MQQPASSWREISNNHIGNNNTFHQGDNTFNLHLPLQPARAAIHVIPYPRNEEIVHRPDLVEKLNTLLPQTSPSTYCSAALWGLGGSGKTQIALNYAYQRCDNVNCSVFWVHADSEATFSQDYKTIARKFGIDESLKSEDLFAAVRDQITTQPDWVLVLDNADDLKLFGVGQVPEQPKSLLKYIPHAPTGTVLWTSRDARIVGTLVGPRRGIAVARMRSNEAEELLIISRSTEMDTVEAEIATLLKELQWLPLAITQAGAYMRRTSTSVKEYLSLLAQRKKRWSILKKSEFDRHRRLNVPNNVLETWSISIDRIRQESEMAYKILHVIAYIDNQNIPHEIIAATIRHGNEKLKKSSEKEEEADDESEAEAVEAITRLKEFSFIGVRQVEDGSRNYEIHKLVQEAARYGLSLSDPGTIITENIFKNNTPRKESEGYFSSIALQVIKDLFPKSQQNTWAQCEKYLAHAVQVAKWVDLSDKQNETAKLLNKVSYFLHQRGRWREKELVDKTALELRQKVLGDTHPDTIQAIANLASTYYGQGRYSKAEPLKVQVLSLCQEVLGDKHPDTIRAIANLASIYHGQGQYSKAEPLNIQVLSLCQEVLGDKHPNTIQAIANLASTYYGQGRYSEAEPLKVQVLSLCQEVLGDKHPDTIQAIANLASTCYKQGQYSKAEPLNIQVLSLCQEVLGDKHPDTIRAIASLASTYCEQGRYSKAEPLEVQVLSLCQEVLGDKHPNTIQAIASLASIYYRQGRYSEAEPLEVQVLSLCQEVLGDKHPDTIQAIASLASIYYRQGRYSEAEPLEVQVLSLCQEVLGDKHPNTIRAIASLASTYHEQGRYSEAEPLEVQVLSLCREVLGDKHPNTIQAIASLASTYNGQGRYSKAEPLNIQVLSLCREVLGDKHPNTIQAIANLASIYHGQGRYIEAEPLEVQVLSLRQEVLGDKHPITFAAMHNLAYTWECQGRHHDALVLMQQCWQYRRDTLGPGHPDTVRSSKAVEKWESQISYSEM